MDLLIKSAVVVNSGSPHHMKKRDILIRKGKIEKIAARIEHKGEVFKAPNLHVSIGWFDMRANFCDPGNEHREDICTGLQAARKGGFTGVCIVPETSPPLCTKSHIDYVRNRSKGSCVELYPCGTVSANREGKQMAELFDMRSSGAVAFTDGKRPMANAALLSTAMLYARNFNGLIITFPLEPSLSNKGQMHEGAVSTQLGMKGIPALAEELMVARDLKLCAYNEARVHFTGISTEGALSLIREARKNGLNVSCDVYAHNLLLTDKDLVDFDQQKKVLPPLRDESHRKALIKGLKDGTISAICSDHSSYEVERKNVEFEHAAFGIIGLESAFGVLNKALHKALPLETIIEKISSSPREVLGLPVPEITEGASANLTLFDPDAEWVLDKSELRSKSANTPFLGESLRGQALAIYNDGRLDPCQR